MSVGIFLPNWLGDLVMATPTLRAMRRHFGPRHRLIGIMRPNLAELLDGTDWLDEQWLLDPRSDDRQRWRRSLVGRMRRERFETVVLLTNSFHTAMLAWLGRAKRRVGYARDGRSWLLTDRVHPPRSGGRILAEPVVATYLRLAGAAGCPDESPRLELALTEPEREKGQKIAQRLGLRGDGRIVTINCSGAYGAAKLWPTEHFGTLARQIVDRLDHDVLVICGPKERQTARDIVARADSPRVFSLAEEPLGLATSKGCIALSQLMVSTDSGPRHVAAALGKRVITLLGPTLPTWIENPTVADPFPRVAMDCLGCGKRTCPLGHHRCMQDLLPARVLESVRHVLAECKPTVCKPPVRKLGVSA